MIPNSILTRNDYQDYVVYLYFDALPGSRPVQYLEACMRRAYHDFNRTLRGLEAIDPRKEIYSQAADGLKRGLERLKIQCAGGMSREEFDEWHRDTCYTLISIYKEHSFAQFTVGQAQK